jgi:arsenate reductase (thioredoxin)
MTQQRTKVLFICLGNACRSPMAEAIARKDAVEEIEPNSAGLAPLGFVAQMTKETLLRNGYSPDGLESKAISADAWQSAELIINMSGYTKEQAFRSVPSKARIEDWEIEDPYGNAEKYQGTYERIRMRIGELTERLRKERARRTRSETKASAISPKAE